MASNQSIDDIVSKFRDESKQISLLDNTRDTIIKILHRINTDFDGCLPNVRCSPIRESVYFEWIKCMIKFNETCNFDITVHSKLYSLNYEIVLLQDDFVISKLFGNTIDDDWETKFFETLKFLIL